MIRTTVLVDEELLIEARQLAARDGKSLTDLIREALAQYVAAHRANRNLSFIGLGDSGNPHLANQTEEILVSELDPVRGWARHPTSDRPADDSSSKTE